MTKPITNLVLSQTGLPTSIHQTRTVAIRHLPQITTELEGGGYATSIAQLDEPTRLLGKLAVDGRRVVLAWSSPGSMPPPGSL
jgi:hypothetical protein